MVNRKRKTVIPVVKERQSLAQHLAGLMQQLGLERRPKEVPIDLSTYVAEKYGRKT